MLVLACPGARRGLGGSCAAAGVSDRDAGMYVSAFTQGQALREGASKGARGGFRRRVQMFLEEIS